MLDERLEQAIRQKNARLVVLDPIQSSLGVEVDMHRANEISLLMKRVSVLAEKYHCAIALIGYMNKNSTGKSSYRGLGSIDFQGGKECPDCRMCEERAGNKSSLSCEKLTYTRGKINRFPIR